MISLHNHTCYSDGFHSPEHLIREAVKQELKVVGINDHYQSLKCNEHSLSPEACETYLQELRALQKKYAGKIQLKIGLEIDFSALRTDFTHFPWDITEEIDYVLLEYVEEPVWEGMGLREAKLMRDRFRCAVGFAHNDIEKNFSPHRYDELLDALETAPFFFELCPSQRNCRGITPYYYYAEDFFVQARGRDIFFSIGTDMHQELSEIGDVSNAWDFLVQLGLREQIIFL